jgi:hypothetical protein
MVMASILEKRKAQIREALEKANAVYKKKDYETTLKILQPYRSDKRVQRVIKRVEAARQKSIPIRKVKPASQVNYTYATGILLAACGLLFIVGIFLNGDSSNILGFTEFAAIYYTDIDGAYVRACTEANCEILATLPAGEEVDFIETAEGASINDSTVWYRVLLSDGREGYIHSTVVSTIRPTPAPTRRPQTNPQPTQAPAVAPQTNWNCSRNRYNCNEFAGCSEIMSYWNSCPGDPSNLDGDSDGRPCETQCGG